MDLTDLTCWYDVLDEQRRPGLKKLLEDGAVARELIRHVASFSVCNRDEPYVLSLLALIAAYTPLGADIHVAIRSRKRISRESTIFFLEPQGGGQLRSFTKITDLDGSIIAFGAYLSSTPTNFHPLEVLEIDNAEVKIRLTKERPAEPTAPKRHGIVRIPDDVVPPPPVSVAPENFSERPKRPSHPPPPRLQASAQPPAPRSSEAITIPKMRAQRISINASLDELLEGQTGDVDENWEDDA